MSLFHNVRYALRLFAKSPGFTVTAVAVLAVGIGLNVAVFTALNVLLLKPIGGRADGKLATLVCTDHRKPGSREAFAYRDYRVIRDGLPAGFSSVMAQRLEGVGITENGSTRRSFAAAVSSNYFTTLASAPMLGRAFLPTEEESAFADVAIVSHAYWRTHGASPKVLGTRVRINGRDFTIVGVTAAAFGGTTALFSPEFWVPLRALDNAPAERGASAGNLHLVARLRPGLDVEQAAALLAPVAARINSEASDARERRISAEPLSRLATGTGTQADSEMAGVMLFLLGLSATVLLVATINLANMMLARGQTRQREIAVRLALGARPVQVLGQLVLEAVLLSTTGAVLGLALAVAAIRLLAARVAPALPFVLALDAWPDFRVVLATAGFAGACAIFFGLAPAWHLVRTNTIGQLKAGPSPVSASGRYRLRNVLVASQLAISLALLSAAALFVHGAWRATAADPGFTLASGIVATIDPSLAGYDEQRGRETYRRVLDRVRSMPGVEAASVASVVPFSTSSELRSIRRPERRADVQWTTFNVVGSNYFRTLRLPILRGREFTRPEEENGTGRVAIVDETLARKLWPGTNALGQSLQLGSDDDDRWEQPLEVVGIVAPVRQGLFDTQAEPHVYVPLASAYRSEMTVHLRTRATTAAALDLMLQQVRRELVTLDSRLAVLSVRTLEQHRDASIYMWIARATARLFSAFALAALGLAMLGVYGVKAFLVARRTREIGIRVALGASRADILRLVVGDSVRLTAAGLAAGLALGVCLSRLLTGWVYGLGSGDVLAPLAAALLLAASALGASYLPARRALQVPPSVAFRTE